MDNQSGSLSFIKMNGKRISQDWPGLSVSACLFTRRHLMARLFSSFFSTTMQLYFPNSKQATAADPGSEALNKNVFVILN